MAKEKETPNYIRMIRMPSVEFFPGIVVDSHTVLEFKTESVEQKLENLVFTSVKKISGENYEGTYHTTIQLQEGDVLIYNGDEHGYVKPVESFGTIAQAIQQLEYIKDLG